MHLLFSLRFPHQILTFYFPLDGDKKEMELLQLLKTPLIKSFLTAMCHLNSMPLFLAAARPLYDSLQMTPLFQLF